MHASIKKRICQSETIDMNEQIEKYLLGALSAAEANAFEEKLKSDSDLNAEVEMQRTLMLGIETAALREKMSSLYSESNATGEAKIKNINQSKNRINWWAIAAGFAFLVAIGSYFLIQPLGNRNFNKFYFPDPGLPSPMGSTEDYDFYDGMVDYKYGNYNDAIHKWEPLLQNDPANDTLKYYLGSALTALHKPSEAVEYFNDLIETQNAYQTDDARWYWSLNQLQLNNKVLIREKWQNWNFLELNDSPYPIQDFWNSIQE